MCKLAVILSAAPIAPATICNLIAQSFVTDYFMNEENKNWQFFHSFVGFFVGFNAHISKTELINILRKYSDNCAKKKKRTNTSKAYSTIENLDAQIFYLKSRNIDRVSAIYFSNRF